MAVTPLFMADRDALLSELRLTGAVSKVDTNKIIDGAIQEVRLGFYDCLSDARVAAIIVFDATENPATANERTRVRAEKTEVMWVRMLLLTRLPNFFLDSSGDTPQAFNEEGLTREPRVDMLTRQLHRMNAQINKNLDSLKDDGDCSLDNEVQSTTFEPDTTPPKPFESIAPILIP